MKKELYYRLIGYGMDNSLILYDITSTYFEGAQAEISKPGYSRDKRGDLDQIVVGACHEQRRNPDSTSCI